MPDSMGPPVFHLTEGRLEALRNLARKQAGDVVGWIRIAEARALTELGLAARDQGGWRITESGKAALSALAPAKAKAEATILQFHPR